jgi:hypothetical protein
MDGCFRRQQTRYYLTMKSGLIFLLAILSFQQHSYKFCIESVENPSELRVSLTGMNGFLGFPGNEGSTNNSMKLYESCRFEFVKFCKIVLLRIVPQPYVQNMFSLLYISDIKPDPDTVDRIINALKAFTPHQFNLMKTIYKNNWRNIENSIRQSPSLLDTLFDRAHPRSHLQYFLELDSSISCQGTVQSI